MDLKFEPFRGLQPRAKPKKSDAPTVTLARGSHNALYFNTAASDIIRSQPLRYMLPGSINSTMQGAFKLVDESERGALPMVESTKGRKRGTGTYQVGQVRAFFEEFGLHDKEQHVFTLEWNESIPAFLFDAPFVQEYCRKKLG